MERFDLSSLVAWENREHRLGRAWRQGLGLGVGALVAAVGIVLLLRGETVGVALVVVGALAVVTTTRSPYRIPDRSAAIEVDEGSVRIVATDGRTVLDVPWTTVSADLALRDSTELHSRRSKPASYSDFALVWRNRLRIPITREAYAGIIAGADRKGLDDYEEDWLGIDVTRFRTR